MTSVVNKMRFYSNGLTASFNLKGVLVVDTVKGCSSGMSKYPNGGCYGECYANKTAIARGFIFSKSVSRIINPDTFNTVFKTVKKQKLSWYRVGVNGDPSHDWENTVLVCDKLKRTFKIPVIVTKHWVKLNYNEIQKLKNLGAVINTSISPLDTMEEIEHRLKQADRIKKNGVESILRIVTCDFLKTELAKKLNRIQDWLLSQPYKIIDNPLRATKNNQLFKKKHIGIAKIVDNVVGSRFVSLHKKDVFMGECKHCIDQCGVKMSTIIKENGRKSKMLKQAELFPDEVELVRVDSVIGSGYEKNVSELAILDGVAYRAARKNMQIHSAIILKINNVFSGFFTYQVNHEAKEFCLLQSAMSLDKKDKKIYSDMVSEIIKQNTFGYPMIMTVSTKHDLECPSVYKKLGFFTYLKLSGFEYMVYGTPEQVRMKRLAHATMTNTWTTTRSDWLKMKKEWNAKIEAAGEKYNIPNPKFASRDGCWQGKNGYSNVVLTKREIDKNGEVKTIKGKSFNGNASVLDPVACEVIIRFFMPTKGNSIYNPFGGGVQFGFVAGSYNYNYTASEIRQNQCDANNILCQDFNNVKWIKSDSSKYSPNCMFDLCFSCPPYYKVEKYIDYDGVIPDGELNNISTYEEFRDTLFLGYKKAIEHLSDNRFFVVMTGDSRDKNGAYYGCESEHELFFKEQGLHIYNKIVYLECEFTRLAHAKRTLDYRKFPKREQKILVFFKGDMKTIKNNYPPIGRL